MISRLKGELVSKHHNSIVLDVVGIGYEVELPLTDACELLEVGKTYSLHTHFVVREDAQLLFGFIKEGHRDLFRLLIKINGVGPKVALAILSGLDVVELIRCFQESDVARLTKIPGIGKKTAERLVIEMRDRLTAWSGYAAMSAQSEGKNLQMPIVSDKAGEARAALEALGYKSSEAERAIKRVADDDRSVEDIIREALRGMVKN